jgi:hypothetical protein
MQTKRRSTHAIRAIAKPWSARTGIDEQLLPSNGRVGTSFDNTNFRAELCHNIRNPCPFSRIPFARFARAKIKKGLPAVAVAISCRSITRGSGCMGYSSTGESGTSVRGLPSADPRARAVKVSLWAAQRLRAMRSAKFPVSGCCFVNVLRFGCFRKFGATHAAVPAMAGGEYGNTRARRSSKPARPYICRLTVLSRLIRPSTWPALYDVSTAAATADMSSCKLWSCACFTGLKHSKRELYRVPELHQKCGRAPIVPRPSEFSCSPKPLLWLSFGRTRRLCFLLFS